MIHTDCNFKVVGIFVSRRVIAYALSVYGLFKLAPVLFDIEIYVPDLGEVDDIGVICREILGARNGKLACCFIYIESDTAVTEGNRTLKGRSRRSVLLAVLELFLDLSYGRMSSLVEPGRELTCTVLTKISVLKFPVTEKSYLLSANITILLIKKSHIRPPHIHYR